MSHEVGSRNVYSDLGFSNADEMLAKTQLVSDLSEIISSRGYVLREVADWLGCATCELRNLLRGQFHEVTVRQLEASLARLNSGVSAQEVFRKQRPGRHWFTLSALGKPMVYKIAVC